MTLCKCTKTHVFRALLMTNEFTHRSRIHVTYDVFVHGQLSVRNFDKSPYSKELCFTKYLILQELLFLREI